MNGISNVFSADEEIRQNIAAIENFDRRIIETGKVPGTHSLGVQFRTLPHPDEISEDAIQFVHEDALVESLLNAIAHEMETDPQWDQLAQEDIKNGDAKNLRRMMKES